MGAPTTFRVGLREHLRKLRATEDHYQASLPSLPSDGHGAKRAFAARLPLEVEVRIPSAGLSVENGNANVAALDGPIVRDRLVAGV